MKSAFILPLLARIPSSESPVGMTEIDFIRTCRLVLDFGASHFGLACIEIWVQPTKKKAYVWAFTITSSLVIKNEIRKGDVPRVRPAGANQGQTRSRHPGLAATGPHPNLLQREPV